jgi:hypothetical protein
MPENLSLQQLGKQNIQKQDEACGSEFVNGNGAGMRGMNLKCQTGTNFLQLL